MPTIGPVEVLVFLVLAALVVYLALRRRVPTGVLILSVIVLSPVVAVALATFLARFCRSSPADEHDAAGAS